MLDSHLPHGVVWLWALAIVAASSLALTEGNSAAGVATAAIIPCFPRQLDWFKRGGLFAITCIFFGIGETSLLLGVPLGFALAGFQVLAATSVVVLTCAVLGSQHIQSVAVIIQGETFHLGSFAFVLVPASVAAVTVGAYIGWRGLTSLLATALFLCAAVHLGRHHWISVETFTSPAFRTTLALVPMIVASGATVSRCSFGKLRLSSAFVGCLVAAVATQFIPAYPITSVVFDEGHGRWETVLAPFGPDDFGRSASYTYTLLRRYADRLVGNTSVQASETDNLPLTSSAFFLKMPTRPLGKDFSNRLENWVRQGGRLIVVADHTDLYDTTQNINELLERFGARINSDAVFDYRGMPTAPITLKPASVAGRIDALGEALVWQTGASLAALPANAVELATFGLSFAEPGDYSRPNRFGPFVPRLSLRYFRHTAVSAFSVGSGAVVVILDSTPWSTFSVFKREYFHLFRGIVHALSAPVLLWLWGWGVWALAVAACLLLVTRHPVVVVGSGVVLGLTVGAASRIGMASHFAPVEGREFGLRVASGASAKFEFLPQLVLAGERNYSRIVSSISKYGLDPAASQPGSEIPHLANAKKWLVIEPDASQLPERETVVEHLGKGGNLTILFAPDQAMHLGIRRWLATLGMTIQNSTALATAEDARLGEGGILERRGPVLLRDSRAVTASLPHSILKTREADQFIQTYTIRPTRTPQVSGLLSLGFSADQFADTAVGDVWEGIHPSSIGRLRERQLAAILLGQDLVVPFPEDLVIPKQSDTLTGLSSFVLLVDGSTVLKGDFSNMPKGNHDESLPAPIDDPVVNRPDFLGGHLV